MAKPFYDEGVHIGEITAQGFNKAKSGTRQFMIRVKVLGLPVNEDGFTPHDQQFERTIYMALTAATVPFVAETLRHLGYEEDSFGPLDPNHSKHHSFVGQQVNLYCRHEEFDGQWNEKWSISRGLSPLQSEALTTKEVRELDALFGKALKGGKADPTPATTQTKSTGKATTKTAAKKSVPVKNNSARKAKPEPSDDEITDSDVPF